MKSLPGYPGAPAVVLYREELTKDDLHSVQHYERVKILTEEGKKYANVELPYFSSIGTLGTTGDDKTLEDISGRTIHPDGTIIPFTGKPYLKVLEKASGYKVQEKVFTLPDVEVGSIIEYRYATRINDNIFESPIWLIQDDLFVKEAHFAWWPTTRSLVDEDEKPINTIAWFPVLPADAKIESHELPATSLNFAPTREYEIHVKNVPPRIKEEFMPPIGSFSYRVNFSFSPYRSQQEYWQAVGKQWSKHANSFANPNGALTEATAKITAGATTPDQKLHKIYAAVMALENTRFTRQHDQREDKASGMGQVKTAADVLVHERGTPTELTLLFVGMARAAGFHAYAMRVPDRTERIFTPMWLDTRQFDDVIAIVNVDGKDVYFDPGARYAGYAQLAWEHTFVEGLRQIDGGTALAGTPGDGYRANHLARVANLTMAADGEITGKVDITYTGAEAVYWRQRALRGDEEELRKEFREAAEHLLPKTLDIEVASMQDVSDYTKPLAVHYKVKGTLGTAVGKRVMLPTDVFRANASSTFPHEKRETSVYFHYPEFVQDAVRINLPAGYTVEAIPTSATYKMNNIGAYAMQVSQTSTSITARRDFVFADCLIERKDYPELRAFYSQLEAKDQETTVLKLTPVTATNSAEPAVTAKPPQ